MVQPLRLTTLEIDGRTQAGGDYIIYVSHTNRTGETHQECSFPTPRFACQTENSTAIAGVLGARS